MHEPLVSIIIPSFIRANLIGETLDSIINQTYTNWECLVVDDGSTDKTQQVVKKYVTKDSRINYYYRPAHKPKGANACRNYGLELSKGQYINWFDSDDIMHPNKLNNQILQLQETDLNFSICKTSKFQNYLQNSIGIINTYESSETTFEDFVTKKNIWLTPAPLFKKDFIISNNLKFDDSLQASQEWDFFSRVLHVDSNFAFLDQVLVYLRVHLNRISSSTKTDKYWHYYLAREKIYDLFNYKFSKAVKSYFFKYFIESYYIMISNQRFEKARVIMNKIQDSFKLSTSKTLQLRLSYLLFKNFGKGYFLIKRIKH